MKIGFIGTGALSEAMIRGICASELPARQIWITPRNRLRSASLEKEFEQVIVGDHNQTVVDNSDLLFITITPDQAESVLRALHFRDGQIVVNCVSTLTFTSALDLIDANVQLYKAIPLPPIAYHLGPIAFAPRNEDLRRFFNEMGTAVELRDEHQLRIVAPVTAQIASFYAIQATAEQWLQNKGIDPEQARRYVNTMYHALATLAIQSGVDSLSSLSNAAATAGGLNEQVLTQLTECGWLEDYSTSLDMIWTRLNQK
ncbi:NAD(P)-binding domain-containing protein [Oceanimonas pelagia]|uniref:NAD(P)-binding domain-containing protein n=1 Tax=Oceanimonas pelagia TaxID=3028314 RepID=A0AA50QB68_9GAMM|nr:NAD(P)-binding domain-containing protein [Oceanimonas pelagia]WMC09849.1 NAD(P)-binding domain-containing protein [Oceanimonas pelagia]